MGTGDCSTSGVSLVTCGPPAVQHGPLCSRGATRPGLFFNQSSSKTSSSSHVRDAAWLRRHRAVRTDRNPESPMTGWSSRAGGARRVGIGWSGCCSRRSRSSTAAPASLQEDACRRALRPLASGSRSGFRSIRQSVAAQGSLPDPGPATRQGMTEPGADCPTVGRGRELFFQRRHPQNREVV